MCPSHRNTYRDWNAPLSEMSAYSAESSLRLLDWYREMGVDAAVSDDAIDWLVRGAVKPGAGYVLPTPNGSEIVADVAVSPRAARAQPVPSARPAQRAPEPATTAVGSAPRNFPATSPDAAVSAARAAATAAPTLQALGEALTRFDGCGLKATAKNLCFYRGAPQARLMIVGEAPGREDDLAGTPFTGPAGDLLQKMLLAIDLTFEQCHITNAVYWRPPGNRHPTPQELDVCQPFLERQTALVAPDIVLLLGAAAAHHVVDIDAGIMRARGKWHEVTMAGHPVRAIVSLAPTYLLKAPSSKQNAWRDLLSVKAALAR